MIPQKNKIKNNNLIHCAKCGIIKDDTKQKDINMTKIKEPVFTSKELEEIQGPRLSIGYHYGELLAGYDFEKKPMSSGVSGFAKAKEKLNGIAKKRQYHEKINEFGWARVDNNKTLVFGIKFSSPGGLTKIGKSVIEKYSQLLGYYLSQVGWKNITVDEYGQYIIPLNQPENAKLLRTLSPSIGFYYRTKRPDLETFEELEFMQKYRENKDNNRTSNPRTR